MFLFTQRLLIILRRVGIFKIIFFLIWIFYYLCIKFLNRVQLDGNTTSVVKPNNYDSIVVHAELKHVVVTSLLRRVLGGDLRHNERRLLGALFLTFWNLANYWIVVWNLATVDVPGVTCITPLMYFDSMGCVYTFYARKGHHVVSYHIGVGSNVVCSTTIGNARASECGTGNRQFPRFFVCARSNIIRYN